MAIIFAGSPSDVSAEIEEPFESDLIAVMRLFPCIYDPSHPGYSNMQQNRVAWYKLSNSLQVSVVECINKWYALLQIFLCLNKQVKDDDNHCSVKWHHYDAMLKLRPQIPQTYAQLIQDRPPFLYGKPLVRQREILIKQIELNRKGLLNVFVSLETKQKTWYQIAQKLNYCSGVFMPVIKWQKYWCELKQSVIEVKRNNLMKSASDSSSTGAENFSESAIKILNLFGVKTTDTLEEISSALGGNLEIDCDMDNTLSMCIRCNKVIDNSVNKQRCEACSKIPNTFCDICMRIYPTDLTVYKVQNWTSSAKLILPPKVSSFASISTCTTCSDELKRQSGLKWIACRICESHNHPLDNLFSTENEVLRKAFADATNVVFKKTDGLPSYICKVCKVQMQQFNNFYMKFDRVQSRLREIQKEYFIGKQGKHNANSPAQRLSIPNAVPESSNMDQNNVTNSAATSQSVRKFTISSITTNFSPKVVNTRTINIQSIVKPTVENSVMPKVPSQSNAQQTKIRVSPVSPEYFPASEKPLITHIPANLKIVKGLPSGGNVQKILPSSNQIVTTRNIVPVVPTPQGGTPASNLPGNNKIFVPNSVAVRPILPLPASTTITLKEKPNIGTASPIINSTTVSGVIAKQMSTSNIRTHISIKTKSGTTTLTPNASKTKATLISADSNTNSRKIPCTTPQIAESSLASIPSVFKIPHETFNPSSPPAFCVQKSGTQGTPTTGTGNKELPKSPQTTATSKNALTIDTPVEIKTEIIDDDDAHERNVNSNQNENRIAVVTSQPPASGGNVSKIRMKTDLNSSQAESQSYGKTALESGVKKLQQNSIQQAPPPQPQPQPHSAVGNKRPRKYWGAVDEFHIPSKLPNQTQSTNAPCPQITIKEEAVDIEPGEDTRKETSQNDSFTNMFYPDSFELCSVSLDADVTKVLQHMIEHQKSTDSDAYQFTNPSVSPSVEKLNSSTNAGSDVTTDQQNGDTPKSAPQPMLKCKRDDRFKIRAVSTTKCDTKTEFENEPSKALSKSKPISDCKMLSLRVLRAKFEDKVRDIAKENELSSKSQKFHLKKLRVKLRKNKNLQKLVLGAIRGKVISRRKSTRLVKNVI